MPQNGCNLILNQMGVKVVESHACYLGLPTCISRSKKVIFNGLQDRLGKKIKGWKERSLSQAAKGSSFEIYCTSNPYFFNELF